MATLLINDDFVTISLSTAEKVEAVHGNVTLARSNIVSARAVPDGMQEVEGLRSPGTGLPGVIMVGTYRSRDRTTFAACHHHRPAVVLDLTDAAFDRVVVTVDHPEVAVATLS